METWGQQPAKEGKSDGSLSSIFSHRFITSTNCIGNWQEQIHETMHTNFWFPRGRSELCFAGLK